VSQISTPQTWVVLIEPISFVPFTLWEGSRKSGTVTSFGSFLTFLFATLIFWNANIGKETTSARDHKPHFG